MKQQNNSSQQLDSYHQILRQDAEEQHLPIDTIQQIQELQQLKLSMNNSKPFNSNIRSRYKKGLQYLHNQSPEPNTLSTKGRKLCPVLKCNYQSLDSRNIRDYSTKGQKIEAVLKQHDDSILTDNNGILPQLRGGNSQTDLLKGVKGGKQLKSIAHNESAILLNHGMQINLEQQQIQDQQQFLKQKSQSSSQIIISDSEWSRVGKRDQHREEDEEGKQPIMLTQQLGMHSVPDLSSIPISSDPAMLLVSRNSLLKSKQNSKNNSNVNSRNQLGSQGLCSIEVSVPSHQSEFEQDEIIPVGNKSLNYSETHSFLQKQRKDNSQERQQSLQQQQLQQPQSQQSQLPQQQLQPIPTPQQQQISASACRLIKLLQQKEQTQLSTSTKKEKLQMSRFRNSGKNSCSDLYTQSFLIGQHGLAPSTFISKNQGKASSGDSLLQEHQQSLLDINKQCLPSLDDFDEQALLEEDLNFSEFLSNGPQHAMAKWQNDRGEQVWYDCSVFSYDTQTRLFEISWANENVKRLKKVKRLNLLFDFDDLSEFEKRRELAAERRKKFAQYQTEQLRRGNIIVENVKKDLGTGDCNNVINEQILLKIMESETPVLMPGQLLHNIIKRIVSCCCWQRRPNNQLSSIFSNFNKKNNKKKNQPYQQQQQQSSASKQKQPYFYYFDRNREDVNNNSDQDESSVLQGKCRDPLDASLNINIDERIKREIYQEYFLQVRQFGQAFEESNRNLSIMFKNHYSNLPTAMNLDYQRNLLSSKKIINSKNRALYQVFEVVHMQNLSTEEGSGRPDNKQLSTVESEITVNKSSSEISQRLIDLPIVVRSTKDDQRSQLKIKISTFFCPTHAGRSSAYMVPPEMYRIDPYLRILSTKNEPTVDLYQNFEKSLLQQSQGNNSVGLGVTNSLNSSSILGRSNVEGIHITAINQQSVITHINGIVNKMMLYLKGVQDVRIFRAFCSASVVNDTGGGSVIISGDRDSKHISEDCLSFLTAVNNISTAVHKEVDSLDMVAFKVEKGIDELVRDFPQHRVSSSAVKQKLADSANALFQSSLILCVRQSVQQVIDCLDQYYALLPMPSLPHTVLTKITEEQYMMRQYMRQSTALEECDQKQLKKPVFITPNQTKKKSNTFLSYQHPSFKDRQIVLSLAHSIAGSLSSRIYVLKQQVSSTVATQKPKQQQVQQAQAREREPRQEGEEELFPALNFPQSIDHIFRLPVQPKYVLKLTVQLSAKKVRMQLTAQERRQERMHARQVLFNTPENYDFITGISPSSLRTLRFSFRDNVINEKRSSSLLMKAKRLLMPKQYAILQQQQQQQSSSSKGSPTRSCTKIHIFHQLIRFQLLEAKKRTTRIQNSGAKDNNGLAEIDQDMADDDKEEEGFLNQLFQTKPSIREFQDSLRELLLAPFEKLENVYRINSFQQVRLNLAESKTDLRRLQTSVDEFLPWSLYGLYAFLLLMRNFDFLQEQQSSITIDLINELKETVARNRQVHADSSISLKIIQEELQNLQRELTFFTQGLPPFINFGFLLLDTQPARAEMSSLVKHIAEDLHMALTEQLGRTLDISGAEVQQLHEQLDQPPQSMTDYVKHAQFVLHSGRLKIAQQRLAADLELVEGIKQVCEDFKFLGKVTTGKEEADEEEEQIFHQYLSSRSWSSLLAAAEAKAVQQLNTHLPRFVKQVTERAESLQHILDDQLHNLRRLQWINVLDEQRIHDALSLSREISAELASLQREASFVAEHAEFLGLQEVTSKVRAGTEYAVHQAQKELKKYLELWEYVEKWRFCSENCTKIQSLTQVDVKELVDTVQEGIRLFPGLREEFRKSLTVPVNQVNALEMQETSDMELHRLSIQDEERDKKQAALCAFQLIFEKIEIEISDFGPTLRSLLLLRDPAFKQRHWEQFIKDAFLKNSAIELMQQFTSQQLTYDRLLRQHQTDKDTLAQLQAALSDTQQTSFPSQPRPELEDIMRRVANEARLEFFLESEANKLEQILRETVLQFEHVVAVDYGQASDARLEIAATLIKNGLFVQEQLKTVKLRGKLACGQASALLQKQLQSSGGTGNGLFYQTVLAAQQQATSSGNSVRHSASNSTRNRQSSMTPNLANGTALGATSGKLDQQQLSFSSRYQEISQTLIFSASHCEALIQVHTRLNELLQVSHLASKTIKLLLKIQERMHMLLVIPLQLCGGASKESEAEAKVEVEVDSNTKDGQEVLEVVRRFKQLRNEYMHTVMFPLQQAVNYYQLNIYTMFQQTGSGASDGNGVGESAVGVGIGVGGVGVVNNATQNVDVHNSDGGGSNVASPNYLHQLKKVRLSCEEAQKRLHQALESLRTQHYPRLRLLSQEEILQMSHAVLQSTKDGPSKAAQFVPHLFEGVLHCPVSLASSSPLLKQKLFDILQFSSKDNRSQLLRLEEMPSDVVEPQSQFIVEAIITYWDGYRLPVSSSSEEDLEVERGRTVRETQFSEKQRSSGLRFGGRFGGRSSGLHQGQNSGLIVGQIKKDQANHSSMGNQIQLIQPGRNNLISNQQQQQQQQWPLRATMSTQGIFDNFFQDLETRSRLALKEQFSQHLKPVARIQYNFVELWHYQRKSQSCWQALLLVHNVCFFHDITCALLNAEQNFDPAEQLLKRYRNYISTNLMTFCQQFYTNLCHSGSGGRGDHNSSGEESKQVGCKDQTHSGAASSFSTATPFTQLVQQIMQHIQILDYLLLNEVDGLSSFEYMALPKLSVELQQHQQQVESSDALTGNSPKAATEGQKSDLETCLAAMSQHVQQQQQLFEHHLQQQQLQHQQQQQEQQQHHYHHQNQQLKQQTSPDDLPHFTENSPILSQIRSAASSETLQQFAVVILSLDSRLEYAWELVRPQVLGESFLHVYTSEASQIQFNLVSALYHCRQSGQAIMMISPHRSAGKQAALRTLSGMIAQPLIALTVDTASEEAQAPLVAHNLQNAMIGAAQGNLWIQISLQHCCEGAHLHNSLLLVAQTAAAVYKEFVLAQSQHINRCFLSSAVVLKLNYEENLASTSDLPILKDLFEQYRLVSVAQPDCEAIIRSCFRLLDFSQPEDSAVHFINLLQLVNRQHWLQEEEQFQPRVTHILSSALAILKRVMLAKLELSQAETPSLKAEGCDQEQQEDQINIKLLYNAIMHNYQTALSPPQLQNLNQIFILNFPLQQHSLASTPLYKEIVSCFKRNFLYEPDDQLLQAVEQIVHYSQEAASWYSCASKSQQTLLLCGASHKLINTALEVASQVAADRLGFAFFKYFCSLDAEDQDELLGPLEIETQVQTPKGKDNPASRLKDQDLPSQWVQGSIRLLFGYLQNEQDRLVLQGKAPSSDDKSNQKVQVQRQHRASLTQPQLLGTVKKPIKVQQQQHLFLQKIQHDQNVLSSSPSLSISVYNNNNEAEDSVAFTATSTTVLQQQAEYFGKKESIFLQPKLYYSWLVFEASACCHPTLLERLALDIANRSFQLQKCYNRLTIPRGAAPFLAVENLAQLSPRCLVSFLPVQFPLILAPTSQQSFAAWIATSLIRKNGFFTYTEKALRFCFTCLFPGTLQFLLSKVSLSDEPPVLLEQRLLNNLETYLSIFLNELRKRKLATGQYIVPQKRWKQMINVNISEEEEAADDKSNNDSDSDPGEVAQVSRQHQSLSQFNRLTGEGNLQSAVNGQINNSHEFVKSLAYYTAISDFHRKSKQHNDQPGSSPLLTMLDSDQLEAKLISSTQAVFVFSLVQAVDTLLPPSQKQAFTIELLRMLQHLQHDHNALLKAGFFDLKADSDEEENRQFDAKCDGKERGSASEEGIHREDGQIRECSDQMINCQEKEISRDCSSKLGSENIKDSVGSDTVNQIDFSNRQHLTEGLPDLFGRQRKRWTKQPIAKGLIQFLQQCNSWKYEELGFLKLGSQSSDRSLIANVTFFDLLFDFQTEDWICTQGQKDSYYGSMLRNLEQGTVETSLENQYLELSEIIRLNKSALNIVEIQKYVENEYCLTPDWRTILTTPEPVKKDEYWPRPITQILLHYLMIYGKNVAIFGPHESGKTHLMQNQIQSFNNNESRYGRLPLYLQAKKAKLSVSPILISHHKRYSYQPFQAIFEGELGKADTCYFSPIDSDFTYCYVDDVNLAPRGPEVAGQLRSFLTYGSWYSHKMKRHIKFSKVGCVLNYTHNGLSNYFDPNKALEIAQSQWLLEQLTVLVLQEPNAEVLASIFSRFVQTRTAEHFGQDSQKDQSVLLMLQTLFTYFAHAIIYLRKAGCGCNQIPTSQLEQAQTRCPIHQTLVQSAFQCVYMMTEFNLIIARPPSLVEMQHRVWSYLVQRYITGTVGQSFFSQSEEINPFIQEIEATSQSQPEFSKLNLQMAELAAQNHSRIFSQKISTANDHDKFNHHDLDHKVQSYLSTIFFINNNLDISKCLQGYYETLILLVPDYSQEAGNRSKESADHIISLAPAFNQQLQQQNSIKQQASLPMHRLSSLKLPQVKDIVRKSLKSTFSQVNAVQQQQQQGQIQIPTEVEEVLVQKPAKTLWFLEQTKYKTHLARGETLFKQELFGFLKNSQQNWTALEYLRISNPANFPIIYSLYCQLHFFLAYDWAFDTIKNGAGGKQLKNFNIFIEMGEQPLQLQETLSLFCRVATQVLASVTLKHDFNLIVDQTGQRSSSSSAENYVNAHIALDTLVQLLQNIAERLILNEEAKLNPASSQNPINTANSPSTPLKKSNINNNQNLFFVVFIELLPSNASKDLLSLVFAVVAGSNCSQIFSQKFLNIQQERLSFLYPDAYVHKQRTYLLDLLRKRVKFVVFSSHNAHDHMLQEHFQIIQLPVSTQIFLGDNAALTTLQQQPLSPNIQPIPQPIQNLDQKQIFATLFEDGLFPESFKISSVVDQIKLKTAYLMDLEVTKKMYGNEDHCNSCHTINGDCLSFNGTIPLEEFKILTAIYSKAIYKYLRSQQHSNALILLSKVFGNQEVDGNSSEDSYNKIITSQQMAEPVEEKLKQLYLQYLEKKLLYEKMQLQSTDLSVKLQNLRDQLTQVMEGAGSGAGQSTLQSQPKQPEAPLIEKEDTQDRTPQSHQQQQQQQGGQQQHIQLQINQLILVKEQLKKQLSIIQNDYLNTQDNLKQIIILFNELLRTMSLQATECFPLSLLSADQLSALAKAVACYCLLGLKHSSFVSGKFLRKLLKLFSVSQYTNDFTVEAARLSQKSSANQNKKTVVSSSNSREPLGSDDEEDEEEKKDYQMNQEINIKATKSQKNYTKISSKLFYTIPIYRLLSDTEFLKDVLQGSLQVCLVNTTPPPSVVQNPLHSKIEQIKLPQPEIPTQKNISIDSNYVGSGNISNNNNDRDKLLLFKHVHCDPICDQLIQQFSILDVLRIIDCHIPLIIDPSGLYFGYLDRPHNNNSNVVLHSNLVIEELALSKVEQAVVQGKTLVVYNFDCKMLRLIEPILKAKCMDLAKADFNELKSSSARQTAEDDKVKQTNMKNKLGASSNLINCCPLVREDVILFSGKKLRISPNFRLILIHSSHNFYSQITKDMASVLRRATILCNLDTQSKNFFGPLAADAIINNCYPLEKLDIIEDYFSKMNSLRCVNFDKSQILTALDKVTLFDQSSWSDLSQIIPNLSFKENHEEKVHLPSPGFTGQPETNLQSITSPTSESKYQQKIEQDLSALRRKLVHYADSNRFNNNTFKFEMPGGLLNTFLLDNQDSSAILPKSFLPQLTEISLVYYQLIEFLYIIKFTLDAFAYSSLCGVNQSQAKQQSRCFCLKGDEYLAGCDKQFFSLLQAALKEAYRLEMIPNIKIPRQVRLFNHFVITNLLYRIHVSLSQEMQAAFNLCLAKNYLITLHMFDHFAWDMFVLAKVNTPSPQQDNLALDNLTLKSSWVKLLSIINQFKSFKSQFSLSIPRLHLISSSRYYAGSPQSKKHGIKFSTSSNSGTPINRPISQQLQPSTLKSDSSPGKMAASPMIKSINEQQQSSEQLISASKKVDQQTSQMKIDKYDSFSSGQIACEDAKLHNIQQQQESGNNSQTLHDIKELELPSAKSSSINSSYRLQQQQSSFDLIQPVITKSGVTSERDQSFTHIQEEYEQTGSAIVLAKDDIKNVSSYIKEEEEEFEDNHDQINNKKTQLDQQLKMDQSVVGDSGQGLQSQLSFGSDVKSQKQLPMQRASIMRRPSKQVLLRKMSQLSINLTSLENYGFVQGKKQGNIALGNKGSGILDSGNNQSISIAVIKNHILQSQQAISKNLQQTLKEDSNQLTLTQLIDKYCNDLEPKFDVAMFMDITQKKKVKFMTKNKQQSSPPPPPLFIRIKAEKQEEKQPLPDKDGVGGVELVGFITQGKDSESENNQNSVDSLDSEDLGDNYLQNGMDEDDVDGNSSSSVLQIYFIDKLEKLRKNPVLTQEMDHDKAIDLLFQFKKKSVLQTNIIKKSPNKSQQKISSSPYLRQSPKPPRSDLKEVSINSISSQSSSRSQSQDSVRIKKRSRRNAILNYRSLITPNRWLGVDTNDSLNKLINLLNDGISNLHSSTFITVQALTNLVHIFVGSSELESQYTWQRFYQDSAQSISQRICQELVYSNCKQQYFPNQLSEQHKQNSFVYNLLLLKYLRPELISSFADISTFLSKIKLPSLQLVDKSLNLFDFTNQQWFTQWSKPILIVYGGNQRVNQIIYEITSYAQLFNDDSTDDANSRQIEIINIDLYNCQNQSLVKWEKMLFRTEETIELNKSKGNTIEKWVIFQNVAYSSITVLQWLIDLAFNQQKNWQDNKIRSWILMQQISNYDLIGYNYDSQQSQSQQYRDYLTLLQSLCNIIYISHSSLTLPQQLFQNLQKDDQFFYGEWHSSQNQFICMKQDMQVFYMKEINQFIKKSIFNTNNAQQLKQKSIKQNFSNTVQQIIEHFSSLPIEKEDQDVNQSINLHSLATKNKANKLPTITQLFKILKFNLLSICSIIRNQANYSSKATQILSPFFQSRQQIANLIETGIEFLKKYNIAPYKFLESFIKLALYQQKKFFIMHRSSDSSSQMLQDIIRIDIAFEILMQKFVQSEIDNSQQLEISCNKVSYKLLQQNQDEVIENENIFQTISNLPASDPIELSNTQINSVILCNQKKSKEFLRMIQRVDLNERRVKNNGENIQHTQQKLKTLLNLYKDSNQSWHLDAGGLQQFIQDKLKKIIQKANERESSKNENQSLTVLINNILDLVQESQKGLNNLIYESLQFNQHQQQQNSSLQSFNLLPQKQNNLEILFQWTKTQELCKKRPHSQIINSNNGNKIKDESCLFQTLLAKSEKRIRILFKDQPSLKQINFPSQRVIQSSENTIQGTNRSYSQLLNRLIEFNKPFGNQILLILSLLKTISNDLQSCLNFQVQENYSYIAQQIIQDIKNQVVPQRWLRILGHVHQSLSQFMDELVTSISFCFQIILELQQKQQIYSSIQLSCLLDPEEYLWQILYTHKQKNNEKQLSNLKLEFLLNQSPLVKKTQQLLTVGGFYMINGKFNESNQLLEEENLREFYYAFPIMNVSVKERKNHVKLNKEGDIYGTTPNISIEFVSYSGENLEEQFIKQNPIDIQNVGLKNSKNKQNENEQTKIHNLQLKNQVIRIPVADARKTYQLNFTLQIFAYFKSSYTQDYWIGRGTRILLNNRIKQDGKSSFIAKSDGQQ